MEQDDTVLCMCVCIAHISLLRMLFSFCSRALMADLLSSSTARSFLPITINRESVNPYHEHGIKTLTVSLPPHVALYAVIYQPCQVFLWVYHPWGKNKEIERWREGVELCWVCLLYCVACIELLDDLRFELRVLLSQCPHGNRSSWSCMSWFPLLLLHLHALLLTHVYTYLGGGAPYIAARPWLRVLCARVSWR